MKRLRSLRFESSGLISICATTKRVCFIKTITAKRDKHGANIAQANGAISDADFSSKISIAYKECLETKYWLSLLKNTDYIDDKVFQSMHKDADELAEILFSIFKKTRIK